jgi:hypothetical protein
VQVLVDSPLYLPGLFASLEAREVSAKTRKKWSLPESVKQRQSIVLSEEAKKRAFIYRGPYDGHGKRASRVISLAPADNRPAPKNIIPQVALHE